MTSSLKTKMYKSQCRSQIIKKHTVRGVPAEGFFCNYSHRICTQNRLDGFEYCLKHILEDKNAPYKQCNYVSNRNGKRCMNAAPKADRKDGLCSEHTKKAAVFRQKTAQKSRQHETPETLLEELDRYGSKEDSNGNGKKTKQTEHQTHRILDYASSDDSEKDVPLVDQAWRGDGDSDAESVDSEQEDYLKKAGVYTAEEVATITRDKLIRLQSLYIDQFKRLQHVLKEKRRKYLHAKKLEMETLRGLQSYKDDSMENQDQQAMLMAMKRYHRRFGKEALLHQQSKERRISESEGANHKSQHVIKCISTYKNVKCNKPAIPLSKFCYNHILEDPHQVLFKPCSFGEGTCQRPCHLGLQDDPRCHWHSEISHLSGLLIKQQESNTESEHHVDVVNEDMTVDVIPTESGNTPLDVS